MRNAERLSSEGGREEGKKRLSEPLSPAPITSGIAMLRTGVDMIEIERIAQAVTRHGQRFLERVYTADELSYCGRRTESLAARFAAKEAIAKVLGTGIWQAGICWTDLEVIREEVSGAPLVRLHCAARHRAEALSLVEWSLSLSHTRIYAVAFVVAVSQS
jgi:holo-[acyl-carrier protein] synthase